MMERRLESRFLCSDLIRVDWQSSGGSDRMRTVEAVLEDISTLGACVQVEEAIPPGATIAISATAGPAVRFCGNVSYCVFREIGYFVGIRFADENQWSTGVFEPQHLTNLQALAARARVQ
jgi:hypothetical protein